MFKLNKLMIVALKMRDIVQPFVVIFEISSMTCDVDFEDHLVFWFLEFDHVL